MKLYTKGGDKGYTFSLRFCTYEGSHRKESNATPLWVYEKGAKYITVGDDGMEPKYDDPIFLEYLDKFLAECGVASRRKAEELIENKKVISVIKEGI